MQQHLIGTRRRAQALILAVLVMVLAALLGATFITIVALNLNATARQSEKSAAFQAAQAGLNYVNAQLTYGTDGEQWFFKNYHLMRDTTVTPPKNALEKADENPTYFTSSERSQSWNGKYIKFPDPDTPANPDAPQFLVRVQRVLPINSAIPDGLEPGDPDLNDRSKLGLLKITTIGVSSESSAFSKQVAYKATTLKNGPLSFVRYDSNYDTKNKRPIESRFNPMTPSASTATEFGFAVDNAQGFAVGHRVMVSENGQGDTIGVVKSITGNTITLTVPTAVTAIYSSNALVRVVSSLYDGLLTIDADGNGSPSTFAPSPDTTLTPQRRVANTTSKGEMHFNNGLVLTGKSNLTLNSDSNSDDFVRVDGRIVTQNAATATLVDVSPTPGATPSPLPDSTTSTATFDSLQKRVAFDNNSTSTDPTRGKNTTAISPFDFTATVDRYREQTQKADLGQGSQYGYGRNVYIDNRDDFEKVSNGGTGYVRLSTPQLHRLWQRKSFDVTTGTPAVAVPGNIAYAGTNGAIGAGSTAHRLAYPRLGTDTYPYPLPAGSLEQRAIRGWVSPWEFRPRGVTIDLRGDSILITRDDRSDKSTSNIDTSKSWKSPTGGDLSAGLGNRVYRIRIDATVGNTTSGNRYAVVDETATPGVFTETLISLGNGPFQGVIFAEGNVRVRGWYNNTIVPLTIVSGNNIYVDGSLRQENLSQKISLIAKQNVVLNPGQFTPRSLGIGDVDVADADEAANNGSDTTVRQQIKLTAALNSDADEVICTPQTANTPLNFKVGDRIVVGTFSEALIIRGIDAANGRLTIKTPISAAFADLNAVPAGQGDVGARVRLLQEAPVVAGKDPVGKTPALFPDAEPTRQTNEYFYRLSRPWHALARDVRFDNAPLPTGSYAYSFSGILAGERVPGLNIEIRDSTVPLDPGQTRPIANVEVKRNVSPGGGPAQTLQYSTTLAENEKTFELLPSDPTSDWHFGDPYDLLDFTPDPGTPSDSTETIAALTGLDFVRAPSTAPRWILSTPPLPTGYTGSSGNIPARMLAYSDFTGAAEDFPLERQVPLTASVGFYWMRNLTANSTLTASNPNYQAIGSRFDREDALGANLDPSKEEKTRYVDSEFYERRDGTSFNQRSLRFLTSSNTGGVGPVIFSNAIPPAANEVSSVVYRPFPAYDTLPLPALRVGPMHLERKINAASAGFSTGTFDTYPITVQAHIYAHEGSWFVIPASVQAPLDEDVNGSIADRENELATRTRRLNYQINFTGTIAQNFSPTADTDYDNEQDPDGLAEGATKRWLDSLATPTTVVTGSVTTFNRGTNWQSITYASDPFLPTDDVSALPVTPDLIYQD